MAAIIHGWSLLGGPDGRRGLDRIRHGVAAWESTGAQLMRPHFLALLAEGEDRHGSGEGLRILAQALTLAETTGERNYQAELYRLQGERLVARAGTGDAEAAAGCFQRSLEIAREQEALSLELRTALSLARHDQRRGRHDAGRDLVGSIYARFAEGFDTPDLREAKALLDDRQPT
jgi:predicted ATPase